MTTFKFFWKEATGVKADIERHAKEEQHILDQIAELDKQDPTDPFVQRSLNTYFYFLDQVRRSKAHVTDKIGRGKA